MAEPARDDYMDDDNRRASANADGGGGSRRKEKRKKKLDAGRLARLFADFRYQYGSELAWDTVERIPIKISHLRHTFGNDEVRMWLGSDKRKMVKATEVVFDPTDTCEPQCVNLFGGLKMEPVAGNYQPIWDLLMHLCADDEAVHAWILDWIAYQLQNLGAKMPSAIVMHGDEGSGKNLFWECVLSIFGEYGTVIGQAELDSQYNGWLSRRLMILCDEVVTRTELRYHKGKLKSMISGDKIQINDKYLPVREERNHVNLIFLSNELQPLALDATDRRYCVLWTPPKRPIDFYRGVAGCMRNGGTEAFMHLLLARDISAFDPYAPPPETGAKRDLIELGRSNPERFWMAWQNDELEAPARTCSAEQAYRMYRRWCISEGEKYPLSNNVFSRMVQRASSGAIAVRAAKIRSKTVRVWVIQSEGVDPAPQAGGFSDWAREQVGLFQTYIKSEYDHDH